MTKKRRGRDVGRKEAAEIFGVDQKTIDRWKERGCPVFGVTENGRGTLYNTAAMADWRVEVAREEATPSASLEDFETSRARKMAAEADMAEIERDRQRGDLVPLDAVMAATRHDYSVVRSRLTALPGSLAASIDPDRAVEIEPIISDGVNDILRELRDDAERYGGSGDDTQGEGGDAEAGPAAQPD